MFQLTDEAQRVIQEFEERIKTLSPDERAGVLERMTSHINALNEEVINLVQALEKSEPEESPANDVRDHI